MAHLVKSLAHMTSLLWHDVLFHKLLAIVVTAAGILLLVVDAGWQIAGAAIGLGCLAAMLEAFSDRA